MNEMFNRFVSFAVALYLLQSLCIFFTSLKTTMIVSIQNQKGGVGKTATAVSLAAVAHASGWHCLLVDLDPQASATDHVAPDHVIPFGMGHVLIGQASIREARWEARPAQPPDIHRLDMLCGDDGLLAADAELRTNGDTFGLRRALAPIRDDYDLVIVDVGPSISQLTINALYAADTIICPLTLTSTSLRGVRRLFELTHRAASQGHAPTVLLLPVAADRRLRETREIVDVLTDKFGLFPKGRLLKPIRYSSAFSRAFGERRMITEYDFAHQRKNGSRDPAAKRAVEDYSQTLDSLLGSPKNEIPAYA